LTSTQLFHKSKKWVGVKKEERLEEALHLW